MGLKMNKMKVFTIKKHFQFLHVRINMEDEVYWLLTTVYESHIKEWRNGLWSELKNITENIVCSWFVGGDFKDILSSYEKRGGNFPLARKCAMFQDALIVAILWILVRLDTNIPGRSR